jgi:CDP-diacylglycerol---serine O-phosphatidyltransferase
MKNTRYIFPNAITLINLILGCSAITVTLMGSNEYNAAWLILLAAICDLFDGWVARLLDAKSELGVQLDSLADMVSFGVAPSIILFKWFVLVLTNSSEFSTFELMSASFGQKIVLLCSFLFAVAAAIRLARFNITPASGQLFNGLTTTASALIISSLWLMISLDSSLSEMLRPVLLNIYFVFALLITLIILMVSNLKMLSLKFNGLKFKENLWQYVLLAGGALSIVIFKIEGIFLSLLFYIVLSLINNLFRIKEA